MAVNIGEVNVAISVDIAELQRGLDQAKAQSIAAASEIQGIWASMGAELGKSMASAMREIRSGMASFNGNNDKIAGGLDKLSAEVRAVGRTTKKISTNIRSQWKDIGKAIQKTSDKISKSAKKPESSWKKYVSLGGLVAKTMASTVTTTSSMISASGNLRKAIMGSSQGLQKLSAATLQNTAVESSNAMAMLQAGLTATGKSKAVNALGLANAGALGPTYALGTAVRFLTGPMGIVLSLVGLLLPAIVSFADGLMGISDSATESSVNMDEFNERMSESAEITDEMKQTIDDIGYAYDEFGNKVTAETLELREGNTVTKEAGESIREFGDAIEDVGEIDFDFGPSVLEESTEAAGDLAKAYTDLIVTLSDSDAEIEDVSKLFDNFAESLKNAKMVVMQSQIGLIIASDMSRPEKMLAIQDLQNEYQTFSQIVDDSSGSMEEFTKAIANGDGVTLEKIAVLENANSKINDLTNGNMGLFESYKTTEEALTKLNAAVEAGSINGPAYAEGIKQLAGFISEDLIVAYGSAHTAVKQYNEDLAAIPGIVDAGIGADQKAIDDQKKLVEDMEGLKKKILYSNYITTEMWLAAAQAKVDGEETAATKMLTIEEAQIIVSLGATDNYHKELKSKIKEKNENIENMETELGDKIQNRDKEINSKRIEKAEGLKDTLTPIFEGVSTDQLKQMKYLADQGEIELDAGTAKWLDIFIEMGDGLEDVQIDNATGALDNFVKPISDNGPEEMKNVVGNMIDGFDEEIEARLEDLQKAGEKTSETYLDGTKAGAEIKSPSRKTAEIAYWMVEGMKLGLDEHSHTLYEKTKEISENIIMVLQQMPRILFHVGDNAIQGLINGIDSKINALRRKMKEAADIVATTVAEATEEESPSKLLKRQGQYAIQGLEIGVEDRMKPLNDKLLRVSSLFTNMMSKDGVPNGGGVYDNRKNFRQSFSTTVNVQGNDKMEWERKVRGLMRQQAAAIAR